MISPYQAQVRALFAGRDCSLLLYHNLQHSLWVVQQAELAAERLQLSPDQTRILATAACWHDLGYFQGAAGHEARSAEYLAQALTGAWSQADIEAAQACIRATRLGAEPENDLAALLADIDLAYGIGSPDYERRSDLLRREWELHQGRYYTDGQWLRMQRLFLQNCHFHSAYAQRYFVPWAKQHFHSLI